MVRWLMLGLSAVTLVPSLRLIAAERGEAEIKGLRLPIFTTEGRLIRRLNIESGSGGMTAGTLLRGHIEFFAADSGTEPVAWMKFEDARYEWSQQVVTGSEIVRFELKAGARLSGRGYVYENRENRLILRSEVTGDFEGTHLAAPEARIIFDPAQRVAEDIIEEILFERTVTVSGMAAEKLGMERVRAAKAHYRAETGKLHLTAPIHLIDKQGVEHPAEAEVMEMRLRPAKDSRP